MNEDTRPIPLPYLINIEWKEVPAIQTDEEKEALRIFLEKLQQAYPIPENVQKVTITR